MLLGNGPYRVLVVDDDADMHTVTKLALKRMKFEGQRIELVSAHSAKEAFEYLKLHPQTAVILLDVVMETESAGLDAVRVIREEMNIHQSRIIMRTGQPGLAPEQKCIDEYDIDGYLPKAEVTRARLYSTVRTALRAYKQIIDLERHKQLLASLHESMLSLHAYESLEETLQKILATALSMTRSDFVMVDLETLESGGEASECVVFLGDGEQTPQRVEAIQKAYREQPELQNESGLVNFDKGTLLSLVIPRDLGQGFVYLEPALSDPLLKSLLPLLTGHVTNALYSTIALKMLESREGPFFDAAAV